MILDDIKGKNAAIDANPVERPNTVGSKGSLKREHGSMGKMVAHMLRFMAFEYNRNQTWGNWPNSRGQQTLPNPVDEILKNYAYYMSEQSIGPNAHLAETTEGVELAPQYTNGSEIYQTIQHMVGPVTKAMKSMTITLESQDPSVISEKKRRVTAITAKKELPEIFAEFAKLGVEYAPERRFSKDIDTALRNATRDPSHKVERLGLDVLNKINADQSVKDMFPKQFLDTQIGGHCAVDITVANGRLHFHKIRPWLTIWDRGEDDDHNRRSLYKGYFESLSKNEIFQRFDLTADEKAEIEKVFESGEAARNSYYGLFPAYDGFNWLDENGYRRMSCITGKFIVTITPQDGEPYNTIYQGTLIGNCVLKSKWGEGKWEDQNIVYDMADPSWPLMSIWIYSPDTILGRNVPMVSRFRQMQEDCDAYLYKIRQLVSRDLGKTYVFNGNQIGEVPAREITDALKSEGVYVANTEDGEEQVAANTRMVELVDMSMDPNVRAYAELRQQMRQDMKDVVSQSSITTGMQQTYIGGGTQQQTVALAENGTVSLYEGFFQHFTYIQQFVLNTAKLLLLTARSKEEAEILFDQSTAEFWEALNDENLQIEDMLVYARIEGAIDEQKRARLNQYGLAMAQNAAETGFTMIDAVILEESRTMRELRRDLLERAEQHQMRKMEERMQAMEAQQAELAQKQQFEGAKFQAEEQGKLQRDIIREQPANDKNKIELMKMNRELQMKEDNDIPVRDNVVQ